MSCATGFGPLGHYLPMGLVKELACRSLFDYLDRKVPMRFINYQYKVCQLAQKHIKDSFTAMAEDFCTNATPQIKATAELIEKSINGQSAALGVFFAGVTVLSKLTNTYAERQNYPTLATWSKRCMWISGFFGVNFLASAYLNK